MEQLIASIRQMMAESKFFEAQIITERELFLKSEPRRDLLLSYIEILNAQKKSIPAPVLIEAAEFIIQEDSSQAEILLDQITSFDKEKNFLNVQQKKIAIALKQGQLKKLHELIFDLNIFLCENHIPIIFEDIEKLVVKFFKDDFNFMLQKLSLLLMKSDVLAAEKLVREITLSTFEKSSPRGIKERLIALSDILKAQKITGPLDLYANMALLLSEGLGEKKDFKRIIELVIYFDDFQFQVLILGLLDKIGILEVAHDYAIDVKNNKDYSFVYFDKYHSHLKKYFISTKEIKVLEKEKLPNVDLELEESAYHFHKKDLIPDLNDDYEEGQLINVIKYQDLDFNELIDISVGLIQSRYFKASVKSSSLALSLAQDDNQFLKACYLKILGLLQLKDLRSAMDTVLSGLEKAKSKDDILSFMYCQAEIFQRMSQNKQARIILKRILEIDSNYRQAKENYEKLDEI